MRESPVRETVTTPDHLAVGVPSCRTQDSASWAPASRDAGAEVTSHSPPVFDSRPGTVFVLSERR